MCGLKAEKQFTCIFFSVLNGDNLFWLSLFVIRFFKNKNNFLLIFFFLFDWVCFDVIVLHLCLVNKRHRRRLITIFVCAWGKGDYSDSNTIKQLSSWYAYALKYRSYSLKRTQTHTRLTIDTVKKKHTHILRRATRESPIASAMSTHIQSRQKPKAYTHTNIQWSWCVCDTELGRWSRYFLCLSLSLSPTATDNRSQPSHLL